MAIDDVALRATVVFTDPGVFDNHIAFWEWGDGSSSPGTFYEVDENTWLIEGFHTYTEPDVYIALVTITRDADDPPAQVEGSSQPVVVFDPEGGFVTGGGWIDSPERAYVAEPSLTGKATFGFVSKYKKGADTPTGNTVFQCRAISA